MEPEIEILLRPPRLEDGKAVYQLIRQSPPLDVNSAYNYFLLCSHFADTCVVAERNGALMGFLSAYREPRRPEVLFIWQVAVGAAARGQGLAGRMLEHLLARPACHGVRWLETTVSPSNAASRRVFQRFAANRGAGWQEQIFLRKADFGELAHEDEILYRVGPLEQTQRRTGTHAYL